MNRTIFALALALAAATPLAAQDSPDFAEVRRILREGMAKEAAPAAAFAVVRDGTVIWEEAIGWADSTGNRRATPNSPFLLASLNKTFETTLAAVLRSQRRVGDGARCRRTMRFPGDLEAPNPAGMNRRRACI